MSYNYKSFKKRIKDVEFIMLRDDSKCWIKIIPTLQKSAHTIIHFMLNDEQYTWDIYDKNGRNSHKIYFKGLDIEPCFYIKIEVEEYKIHFYNKDIEIKKILKKENIIDYLIKNCNCISSNVSIWAVAIYMTSRKEKIPFCYM